MNQLFIKLTGTVNSSNFDEWKKELITQIQAVNIELVTDNDFVTASGQVKSFKAAEKSLKEAKQSAIDQAEEIQQLFSAIDEIAEEARQARLSLERQIKTRKLEIKQHYIQSGIDEIHGYIDEQVDELKNCDLSQFLDRSRFESATSGKAGISGLEKGIDQVCTAIKREISEKVVVIYNNKIKIDALPEVHKILFQDWKSLVCSAESELESEIDKRIARYEYEVTKREAERLAAELKDTEAVTEEVISTSGLIQHSNSEHAAEGDELVAGEEQQKEKYRILINLLSTLDKAKEIAAAIESEYGHDPDIHEIKLVRNRDE